MMFRRMVGLVIGVFAMAFTLFALTMSPAQAVGGTISDGPSCTGIGGTWDGANICSLVDVELTVDAGEVLTISGDVALDVTTTGSLTNDGTLNVDGFGMRNAGTISNSGTVNLGAFGLFNVGIIINDGVIESIGTIDNGFPELLRMGQEAAVINNDGTINNNEIIFNACGVITGNPPNNVPPGIVVVGNCLPFADDDSFSTDAGTTLTVGSPGVLDGDIDLENDPLTASVVDGPGAGNVILNGDGSFVYEPNPGFSGVDSFTYLVDDGAGTSLSATVTINVLNTTMPDTVITAQPADATNSGGATFEFTGTDDVTDPAMLLFECQLDGAGFAPCTSPQVYGDLGDGSHTFEVRAIDDASNADPSPASVTWIVDTVAPSAAGLALPVANGAGWNNTDVTVSFTGSDDGGSGVVSCDADVVLAVEGAGLSVSGGCTDAAGNTGEVLVSGINIDKSAPTVTAPADIEQISAVPVVVSYGDPAVADGLDPNPTVDCQPQSGSVFPLGDTVVTCTATDQAGNVGRDTLVVIVLPGERTIAELIADIEMLRTSPRTSEKAAEKLQDAADELVKATEELAETPPDGKKALKYMGEAAKELLKANDEGADVVGLIDELVEMGKTRAQEAIDEADAAGGKRKDIDKARREMGKAQQDLSNGRPDKAIHHHAKAWDRAMKSIK